MIRARRFKLLAGVVVLVFAVVLLLLVVLSPSGQLTAAKSMEAMQDQIDSEQSSTETYFTYMPISANNLKEPYDCINPRIDDFSDPTSGWPILQYSFFPSTTNYINGEYLMDVEHWQDLYPGTMMNVFNGWTAENFRLSVDVRMDDNLGLTDPVIVFGQALDGSRRHYRFAMDVDAKGIYGDWYLWRFEPTDVTTFGTWSGNSYVTRPYP